MNRLILAAAFVLFTTAAWACDPPAPPCPDCVCPPAPDCICNPAPCNCSGIPNSCPDCNVSCPEPVCNCPEISPCPDCACAPCPDVDIDTDLAGTYTMIGLAGANAWPNIEVVLGSITIIDKGTGMGYGYQCVISGDGGRRGCSTYWLRKVK